LAVCDGPCVLLYETQKLRRPVEFPLNKGRWGWCWEVLGDTPLYHVAEAEALLLAAGDTWLPLAKEAIAPPVDAKRAGELIKAACGEDEDSAKKSTEDLVKLGLGVRPLIEKALKGDIDADAKLRLLTARARVSVSDRAEEALRGPRVVGVLRQLG